MDPLQQYLQQKIQSCKPAGRYLVAYSGGCDSTVLLHAMIAVTKDSPASLLAIHIDHGLHPESANWAKQCAQHAAALAVDCITERLSLEAQKGNLEARARQARYAAFAGHMQEGDVLVTAHHEDDQAETVLLNLLRGSGVEGLAAMQTCSEFNRLLLFRPLLDISHAEILQYAKRQRLSWTDDPSNQHTHFDRNFLRQEIIPLLQQRWPATINTISRSARNCQDASELIAHQSGQDLQHCRSQLAHSIDISKLLGLSTVRQKYLLRAWFNTLGFPQPDRQKLEYILSDFVRCRADANPLLCWSDVELHRFHDKLFAVTRGSRDVVTQSIGFSRDELRLGNKRLPGIAGDLCFNTSLTDAEGLEIRFRQGRESCLLPGRSGHRKLKKLLQQWQVPPWMRQHVPLIYWHDELVAIADFSCCDTKQKLPLTDIQWLPQAAFEWRTGK